MSTSTSPTHSVEHACKANEANLVNVRNQRVMEVELIRVPMRSRIKLGWNQHFTTRPQVWLLTVFQQKFSCCEELCDKPDADHDCGQDET